MANLTLRLVKNSPLTNSEVDGNFVNLNMQLNTTTSNADIALSSIGNLSSLATIDKSNLVVAVNELHGDITVLENSLSNLSGYQVASPRLDEFANGNVTVNTVMVADGTNFVSANLLAIIEENGGSGGGGSGLFNTAISNIGGYAITTTKSNAIVMPATDANARYIVHSIQVVNIGEAMANLTSSILGVGYEQDITLSDDVPVPSNSAAELLKKPKVLQPGNYIAMSATANSTLHASITYETQVDNKLFGKGVDITSAGTFVDLIVATGPAVLESILISNDSAGSAEDTQCTVVWTDGANAVLGYYGANMIIPDGSTIELLEQPKFLPSGHKIRVSATDANRIEAIVSGKYK